MKKLKLMTVIGTRPEIIRLSAIIQCCDRYFEHILVHTGQNYDYELNQIFFEDLGLRAPDYYLNAAGADLGATIGAIIAKSYTLMREVRPDAVLVLGDTNSCLSVIAAKRLHIPIFHMEAGNRCFDECLPEETNRRIVDVTADVNLCYSEHARRYLNASGVPKERTFVVYTFRCTDIFQHNYLPVFDCPYFRLIASVEMTHCLPYLQASTPLTSLPYRRLQSGTILSVQRSLSYSYPSYFSTSHCGSCLEPTRWI